MQDVDWTKFRSYAQRVTSITMIEPRGVRLFHDNRSRIAAASGDHPFGPSFLPQVRRVRWAVCCLACQLSMAPFISPSIVKLELELNLWEEGAEPLFHLLQRHLLNLQELSITRSGTIGVLDLPLSQWISSLQHLTKLWLPPSYHSERIVAAAGGLRELKLFRIMKTSSVSPDDDGMQMEFRPNTFPALRTLEWNSTTTRAVRLLQPSPQVEALESLYLSKTTFDGSVDVPAFTRHLGQACPRLRDLYLNLIPEWPPTIPLPREPLDIESLYGLAPCQSLARIQIGHPFPLTLSESDVHWISTTWRKLECLILCVSPNIGRPIEPRMGTSISLLPVFADVLPNLTHLGLYFQPDDEVRFSGDLYPQYQFKNLKTLKVGFSPVPGGQPEVVGFLLASLCGSSAPLIDAYRPPWNGWSGAHRRVEWERVATVMGLAMRTKSFHWKKMGQGMT